MGVYTDIGPVTHGKLYGFYSLAWIRDDSGYLVTLQPHVQPVIYWGA